MSRESWQNDSILRVLSLRQEVARRHLAPSLGQEDEEAAILDKSVCFRVAKILYNEWWLQPETQTCSKEVWQCAAHLADERRAEDDAPT